VCGLRVACNAVRRDAEGGFQEKPNYFDVDVFDASAENVRRYLHKGSRLAIDGRLEWREWETPDGQKRQAVSVTADTVQFLGGPGEARRGDPSNGDPRDEIDEQPVRQLVGVGTGGEEEDLAF
jgi:single-strand DNA-binding protein